jgi:hypothetical protein
MAAHLYATGQALRVPFADPGTFNWEWSSDPHGHSLPRSSNSPAEAFGIDGTMNVFCGSSMHWCHIRSNCRFYRLRSWLLSVVLGSWPSSLLLVIGLWCPRNDYESKEALVHDSIILSSWEIFSPLCLLSVERCFSQPFMLGELELLW